MNTRKNLIAVSIVGAAFAVAAFTGCATRQDTTVTPGGTNDQGVVFSPVTNTVTVVNTNNLILDAGILRGVSAGALMVTLQKVPDARQPLQDADTALLGVLNGANAKSSAQILEAVGQGGNQALQDQIEPLVMIVSGLEQSLIQKYGPTVAGQISLAMADALEKGVATALASVPPPTK